MGLTFEPLGKYVRLVDERNTNMVTESVLGINIDKYFMPSVANVIGTDLSNYKLLRKGRFACNPMHVGRDGRLPVSRYTEDIPAIVSPAYFMFEIIDENEIEPEYLMLCFRRPDFDRMCWFRTDASVRGGITWEDVCALTIPVPSISEQRKIVHDYQVITDRIELLRKMNENLESQLSSLFTEQFNPLSFEMTGELRLSDFMSFDNGYAFSSDDYLENGPYRIITIGNVGDGYVDTSKVNYIDNVPDKVLKTTELFIGDIVLSLTGNVGRTALIKESGLLLNQRVARIVPNDSKYHPFLYCLFRQQKTKDYLVGISKGTAQLNLSPVELLSTKVEYDHNDVLSFYDNARPYLSEIISISKEIAALEKVQVLFLSHIKQKGA